MHIPPELIRKIAESIRKSDRESLRTKTWSNWHRESLELIALSSVSKMCREEIIPVLWSEVFVYSGSWADIHRLERRVGKLLGVLKGSLSKPSYAGHVKHLSLKLSFKYIYGSPSETLVSHLEELLAISPHLQYLRLSHNEYWLPLLPRLSSLTLPHLKMISFHFSPPNKERSDLLGQFFLNHSGIEDANLSFEGDFDPQALRSSDPLPNLHRFEGSLRDLKTLSSGSHLTTVECTIAPRYDQSIDETLAQELSLLANPFPHVTHLYISSRNVPLTSVSLKAIAASFPSLEYIDGLQATKEYLDFMKTYIESLSWCLPRLHTLRMYERPKAENDTRSSRKTDIPSHDDLKRAFNDSRRLFPSIVQVRLSAQTSVGTD
ncbi:hypothetical protein SISSUDRAFT_1056381 [Sistotremastrum suecicum HHB10207 ss-3]|uniref:F-box domain-containing protein n=1 Tax=Sistotremastrum suecicum HHB10207 ss-3 TaxID=1314776 RepID=A0A165WZ36_9AGAM|nr:hypothetical protein SISSUDRAFT_1056381 [Sistotremastrum suecicum HHB10207 ss-3]